MSYQDPHQGKSFISIIEKEFGRPFSPIELEQVQYWEEAYSREIMYEALKIMILRGIYNLTYMDRILQGWDRANLKTIHQIMEHEAKRKNRNKPDKPKAQWDAKKIDFNKLYEL